MIDTVCSGYGRHMAPPRELVLTLMVLAACAPPTSSVPISSTETDGESGDPVDDLPDDSTTGPEDPTDEPEDPTDDPTGDPTGPGARLPAYAPNCDFNGSRTVAFGPLHTTPEEAEGQLDSVLMGPCGHASTGKQLVYPDGTITEFGASLYLKFAPTGELAIAETGSDTIELFDLAARTRRSITAEMSGFVASFASGVGSRVWTCTDGRLEVHDGANTWLLDEVDVCGGLAAEAAPIIVYRDGADHRAVNTDTGVVTPIAFGDDAPFGDCHRQLTIGYDGDAIAVSWVCYERAPDPGGEDPGLIDVLHSTALYSTHTGLRVTEEHSGVAAVQVSRRGGAWWFSPHFEPGGSADRSVSVLLDGELAPLFEALKDTWMATDGTLLALDRDDEVDVGTILRSDDGGLSFEALTTRSAIVSMRSNWEGTAIAAATPFDGQSTHIDLWAGDAWTWPEPLPVLPGQSEPLFASGAVLLHEDSQHSSLRSPTGELLVQWDEYRSTMHLDARMVLEWGRAHPQLILGGVALLASDGTESSLVPESEQSAPVGVTVAPAAGIVAAWMTDGNQRVLWYGSPPPA